jgi:hypothetical protein
MIKRLVALLIAGYFILQIPACDKRYNPDINAPPELASTEQIEILLEDKLCEICFT